MWCRLVHMLIISALAFIAQAGDGGEDRQIAVGKKVMPIRAGAILRKGPWADAGRAPWRPGTCTFIIAEVKDAWLRTRSGWILKSEVVPCDRAIAFFTDQISRSPSVFAMCSRSVASLDAKEYQAALADGNEAVRLDRTDARGFFCRGRAAAFMGKIDDALADLSRAVALDDGFAAAYCNRAMAHFEKREFSSAISDCNEAIRLDGNWGYPYFVRARARLGLGLDSADPNSISAAVLRRWRKDRDAMQQAMGDIDEFIKRCPNDADGLLVRALVWRAKGAKENANSDLETAVKLAPGRDDVYCLRGAFAYEDHDDRIAIEKLSEAVRVNPRNAEAHALRAWIWAVSADASIRSGQQALASAKVACELSNYCKAWHIAALAAAYAEAGDFDSAVKWQTQALKMNDAAGSSAKKDRARLKLYRDSKPCREVGPLTYGIRKLSQLFLR